VSRTSTLRLLDSAVSRAGTPRASTPSTWAAAVRPRGDPLAKTATSAARLWSHTAPCALARARRTAWWRLAAAGATPRPPGPWAERACTSAAAALVGSSWVAELTVTGARDDRGQRASDADPLDQVGVGVQRVRLAAQWAGAAVGFRVGVRGTGL